METVLLSIIVASGLCAVSSHAGRTYHYVNEWMTWTEAQSYCREHYTDLATIDNMEDVNSLSTLTHIGGHYVWIGLHRTDMYSWMWSLTDSSFYKHGEMEFRNWSTGESTNTGGPYCGLMGDDGLWSDTSCDGPYKAVCCDVRGSHVTYHLTSSSMSWTGAQSFCREHHTDLVSVRNNAENEKVKELVPPGTRVWIGLFRDSWKWTDGSNSSFRFWYQGRPTNNARFDCVYAFFGSSGIWVDYPCNHGWQFICYSLTEGCLQTGEADIFFLIDQSGSIGSSDFRDMKMFILEFLTTFRVGPQHVRVGVAKYSNSPKLEISVTDHSDSKTLEKAVDDTVQDGGGTYTGKGLTFMGPLFTQAEQSRGHKVPQFLVVMTDGESSDEVKTPAETLRAQGITVYAIGVSGAVEAELLEIAGDPAKKFSVKNFDGFNPIKDDIIRDICSKEELAPTTAAMTTEQVTKLAPTTAAMTTEHVTSCLQTSEADIFFLIDQSGSIGSNDFRDMKMFILEFLTTFRVGPQHVRVGVAKYSNSPKLEIDVTDHSDSKTLEKAVNDIVQLNGGTYTGKGLTFMGPLFTQAEQSRGHKVPQFLVVITDGRSSDEVKSPAETLRAQGITVYAIGVSGAVEAQLLEIAGDPAKKFSVKNFNALNPIKDDIIRDICSKEGKEE